MVNITQNWVKQAEEDLEKAKILFDNRKYDGASFYSQQTAEKALKAVILKKDKVLFKIHDLVILGRKANIDDKLLKKLSVLTIAYTESRYKIEDKIPAKRFISSQCEDYLETAKEVLEWSKKKI